jgi:drug/metabolite transporter (DMT)-like permease
VVAAVVVGAGSSALATILFTQAFVDGDPVTPVVLQKVQPLVAVSLAAVMLGERPRPRFGLFLLGGLAGTWLMAFPSPFDVSLHGQAPVLYALMAAALWALGTVLGRFLALELPFQQVTALRFAFGLPAALVAVLVLGAPLRASLHDELFIALLALVTGLVAILLYYYGLQRTTASVASIAELAFPSWRSPSASRLRRDADEHAARRRRTHDLVVCSFRGGRRWSPSGRRNPCRPRAP